MSRTTPPPTRLGPFTVECWAYPAGGSGTYRGVVTSRAYPNGWVLYAQADNFWAFRINNGTGMAAAIGGAVALHQWTHLVATWDGTTARLFVNGVQAAAVSAASYMPNRTKALTIGQGEAGTTSVRFPGRLDEVSVYGQALSPGQVQAHYDAGLNGGIPSTPTSAVANTL